MAGIRDTRRPLLPRSPFVPTVSSGVEYPWRPLPVVHAAPSHLLAWEDCHRFVPGKYRSGTGKDAGTNYRRRAGNRIRQETRGRILRIRSQIPGSPSCHCRAARKGVCHTPVPGGDVDTLAPAGPLWLTVRWPWPLARLGAYFPQSRRSEQPGQCVPRWQRGGSGERRAC